MKKLSLLLFILLTIRGFSQIGVGTANPKAMLDVTSTTSGVLVPRYTGAQIEALSVSANQDGMIVYCTDNNSANATVTSEGHWYWNNTALKWMPATKVNFDSNTVGVKIITTALSSATPYTVGPDDSFIIIRPISISALAAATKSGTSPFLETTRRNFILPDPTANRGRILRIINDASYAGVGSGLIYFNYPIVNRWYEGPSDTYAAPSDQGYQLSNTYQNMRIYMVSDGLRWITIISEY
jgi:hypothetical protein